MDNRWIALITGAAGAALLAIGAYVQVNPRAFTTGTSRGSHAEDLDSMSRVVPLAVPEASPESPGPSVASGAQVPKQITPAKASPQQPTGERLEPCSPWREVGPTYVTDGVAAGVRRVRELC